MTEEQVRDEQATDADEEQGKDLFTRLAEAGEDAIQRIADLPAASRVTETVNGLRARVDELQRRVRGLDELEQRVAELERRVDGLTGETAPATVEAPVPLEPPASSS